MISSDSSGVGTTSEETRSGSEAVGDGVPVTGELVAAGAADGAGVPQPGRPSRRHREDRPGGATRPGQDRHPDEKARLWPRLVELYADFDSYQSWPDREIPVVVLSPRAGG